MPLGSLACKLVTCRVVTLVIKSTGRLSLTRKLLLLSGSFHHPHQLLLKKRTAVSVMHPRADRVANRVSQHQIHHSKGICIWIYIGRLWGCICSWRCAEGKSFLFCVFFVGAVCVLFSSVSHAVPRHALPIGLQRFLRQDSTMTACASSLRGWGEKNSCGSPDSS